MGSLILAIMRRDATKATDVLLNLKVWQVPLHVVYRRKNIDKNVLLHT